MADPMATVEMIVRIARVISEAVGTARRNIAECKRIQIQVDTASGILRILQKKGIASAPTVRDALGDLKETIQRALELVTACKEKNLVLHIFKAGDLSSQLRQVREDISQSFTMANIAINVHLAPNANRNDHRQHQVQFLNHQTSSAS
ncbi:unnamed protein product [Urochloa humidicola]